MAESQPTNSEVVADSLVVVAPAQGWSASSAGDVRPLSPGEESGNIAACDRGGRAVNSSDMVQFNSGFAHESAGSGEL